MYCNLVMILKLEFGTSLCSSFLSFSCYTGQNVLRYVNPYRTDIYIFY